MQTSPYIMHLVRKYQRNSASLFPEELEVLEEAGFFDEDEMDDPPCDSPSLEDRGLYLGSYGS